MSTGQAVTMPEGSFPDLTKPPLVFGGNDISASQGIGESSTTDVPEIEAKENSCVVQNHIRKEKSMKHMDPSDHVNCSQVFRPTNTENVENKFAKAEAAKSKILVNNVEHQHSLSVGASGDGPAVNEKILLLTQKHRPTTNHNDEAIDKSLANDVQEVRLVSKQPVKPKQSFKKTSQTYAKAAQSLPASDRLEESIKLAQKNTISIANSDIQSTGTKLVNGCTEESETSENRSSLNKECTDHPERPEKALRETIGHTTRFTDENSKSNDRKSPESDADVAKADITPDQSQDSTMPEGSNATADGDFGSSSKLNNAPPRRETEKPPRMQKQRSQDRILSKQQKSSFESDSKRENLSRGSSAEWVDSTGVDVHEFLIHVLRTCARDRAILLKIEHDMTSFVNDKTTDFMKFPPMSSYHRMLVHRVATYFCLDHNVDETGKCVIINKTSFSRVPDIRFADQFDPRQCDPPTGRREEDMRRSILKRSNQPRSFDRDDQRGGSWKDRQMSIEEREENYEKTRARIFNDAEANMNSAAMYGRRGVSPMQARIAYGERRSTSGGAELESGARMASQDSLTTRSSSYSAISVLPRHSSYNNLKSGSPNSVSSLNSNNGRMRGYGKSRHHMNMHPRPPTPNRRDGGGGGSTYYYMQNQNQEVPFDAVEDDIAQSWFPDSPELFSNECNTETVVSTESPILLAVPYGTTLPPETVLCHPITGLPYLSPEGYQLVYPSGMAGSNGLPSQYSRYYQMPPPQTRPHPGMPYPQGYNPYDESTQKSQSLNNPDYSTIPPSYPPSMPAATTTTVYSGVQGQHNVNYSYQPAIYRPSADSAIVVNSAQPMQPGAPQQGKQTPVMQGNQNFIHQPMPNSNYPPPYMTGPPANPSNSIPAGMKDPAQPMNSPNNNLQRGVTTQPTPVMPTACPQPVSFNNQTTPNLNSSTTNEKYRQKGTTKDKPPSSNSSQKPAEDELGEKMQAILLKNLQQQQQSQITEAAKTDPKNTVTTALSPSNNLTSTQNTKRGQDPAQNSIPIDAPLSNHVVPPRAIHKNHGYQYQYANGMQQQQQMQFYMMPANNPAGNSSYQAYPQYLAQPQPPHVMGQGMHLVYLSPPPVVGMDGSNNLLAPGNVHMYHPGQIPQQQIQAPHQPYEAPRGFMSNMNNNNAANGPTLELTQNSHDTPDVVVLSKTHDEISVKDAGSLPLNDSSNVSGNVKNVAPPENIEAESVVAENSEADSNRTSRNEAADRANQSNESGLSESGQVSSTITSHITNAANQVYVSHNHPVAPQHPGTPLLVSNIAQDYRISGMNMAGPVAYPAGMIPKYPVYPNLSHAPYMYLPAAATPRNTKLPDMKMYQTQPPQPHNAALMAVQLPNQNSIQLVQAPSIQQQNAVYYAPPGYVATDYSHQAPPPQAPNHKNSSEADSQNDSSLQQSNNKVENASIEPVKSTGDLSGTTENASKDDAELGDTESVAGKQ